MTAVLVAAMLLVLGHQAWRTLRPGTVAPGCPTGVSAWHAVMALAMVAMLVVAMPPALAVAGSAVFAAGTLWAGRGVVRAPSDGSDSRGAHGRLAVACVAMVVMFWPSAAAASPAPVAGALTASAGSGGHGGMAGMTMHAHGSLGASSPRLALTALVVEAVLVVAVLAGRRVVRPSGALPHLQRRADACCETVMALVALAMLAGPVVSAVTA